MHRLLKRQLKRYLGSDTEIPEDLQKFVQAVDEAYTQADDDRALVERSLELTSQELIARNEELREHRKDLEQMVSERTAALEERTIQLRTAAEVARDATTSDNLDDLLSRTVSLIHKRFGFYHTAIYLVDERSQNAILMAVTGQAGQELLDQNFKQPLDESNLVGIAANKGEAVTKAKGISTDNLLFPKTRSELALPLRGGEQVIGVINVHSKNVATFDEDMVSALQVLADQLAVAVSNTRLLQEMTQTLSELEAATGSYTKEAWQEVSNRSGAPIGYRYRGMGIEPVYEPFKIRQHTMVTAPLVDRRKNLSVPIRMRDQVIGTLSLRVEEEEMLPETTVLTESVAERMALALENARLLEETQKQAEQERYIAKISEDMQLATNIEELIQNTIQELQEALSASHIVLQLGTEGELREILNQNDSEERDTI